MLKENEEEIIRFFQEEREVLEGFIRKKLYRVSGMEAEDIVQDVVLRVLSAPLNTSIGNMAAYIYRTACNWLADYFRKKERNPEIQLKEGPDDLIEGFLDENSGVEKILENEKYRKVLFEALDHIKPGQKKIWEAIELDQWSYQELAEEWGVPIGTLLSRKARAEEALRKILKDQWEDRR
jgi:RNA polymerase sigma-70 factor (ECF subfamily)